jgi:ParB family chromosome partitioning protein
MRLQAIVENLQRNDMNPIDEANGYQDLLNDGYTFDQIVEELGLKSPSIVRQRLNLLNLSPEIQGLVASGQLPVIMAWGVALVPLARQRDVLRDIQTGKLRTAEQVKAAAMALRDVESQLDAFATAPRADVEDVATLSRLERKVEEIAAMVALGFKDGECIAAQRVSADRVRVMADKLASIRKHARQMELALLRAATRSEIMSRARKEKRR